MTKRMLSVLLLLVAAALVLASCGLSNGTIPAEQSNVSSGSAAADADSPSGGDDEAGSSSENTEQLPVIAGSSITSETDRLAEFGFPEGTVQQFSETAEYLGSMTDDQTGADLSCDIYFSAGESKAIVSASYTAENTNAAAGDAFLDAALAYLTTCAALEYDGADAEAVKTWITDDIGTVTAEGVSKTVGDAAFTLYGAADENGDFTAVWLEVFKTDA